jgi:hypothetical protein
MVQIQFFQQSHLPEEVEVVQTQMVHMVLVQTAAQVAAGQKVVTLKQVVMVIHLQ